MKHILLIILLSTMLFSAQKQIILGSFLHINNALNDLKRLESYIENDDKLKKLVKINSIRSEFVTVGKYHVVAMSPIDSYVQLLRTLKALEKYYDDAYVLDYPLKVEMLESKPKPKPVEVKSEPVKEVKKVIVTPKKKVAVKKIIIPEIEEEHNNYLLESILALLILIALGYIIYKRRTKNEDIDKD